MIKTLRKGASILQVWAGVRQEFSNKPHEIERILVCEEGVEGGRGLGGSYPSESANDDNYLYGSLFETRSKSFPKF